MEKQRCSIRAHERQYGASATLPVPCVVLRMESSSSFGAKTPAAWSLKGATPYPYPPSLS